MIEKQRKKKMALSNGRSTKNEDKEADQVNHFSLLEEGSKKVLSLTLLKFGIIF